MTLPVLRALLLAAALSPAARAHLEPGSLASPEAGETYRPGDTVVASWVQSQAHAGTYRFHFSADGGLAWTDAGSMRSPGGDGARVRFAWTVPASPTARGRFRVCQPGASCDDPDYRLESGDFTVGSGSALAPRAGSGARLHILRDTRSLEMTLAPGEAAGLAVEAWDLGGRRTPWPLHAAEEGKPGVLRVPLPAAAGPLVLRATSGGRLLGEARLLPGD